MASVDHRYRVIVEDRFFPSARLRAPEGSAEARLVQKTIQSLEAGPDPSDLPWPLAPSLHSSGRRVLGTTWAIVYSVNYLTRTIWVRSLARVVLIAGDDDVAVR